MQPEPIVVSEPGRACLLWTSEAAVLAAQAGAARIPVFSRDEAETVAADLDVWDMWHLVHPTGETVQVNGRTFWFFLAAPRLADPEGRHDVAHIRLLSRGSEGFRDHGRALPQHLTPGTREWSGSAVLSETGELSLYFTAAGRREQATTYEQRLFETHCAFNVEGDAPLLGPWSQPTEFLVADEIHYARADDHTVPPDGLKGFRDPYLFRDPADGTDYVLFAGTAADGVRPYDGVIGIARRVGRQWRMCPPMVAAPGVNSELERPQMVVLNGHYYLFWSTQGRKFRPGFDAPTGLYAMTAESMGGPWRLVNGSGLVAANPDEAPLQAYGWWVMDDGEVLSFVDYLDTAGFSPPSEPELRRSRFGGMAAPRFWLQFNADQVHLTTRPEELTEVVREHG